MATFGRRLAGASDALSRFELTPLKIEDPAVIAISGKAQHTIARFTGASPMKYPEQYFRSRLMTFRVRTDTKSTRANVSRSPCDQEFAPGCMLTLPLCVLCELCASVVSGGREKPTTETQRTRRRHRGLQTAPYAIGE